MYFPNKKGVSEAKCKFLIENLTFDKNITSLNRSGT